MTHPANEKAVADTTASSINQFQTQPNFNPDDVRQQALEAAEHLHVPLFRGCFTSTPEEKLLDIRPLLYRQSIAADPANAREKNLSWAILPINELPKARSKESGFNPSRFVMLVGDVDGGDQHADAVLAAVGAFTDEGIATIYSTSSSQPSNKRWRILIPLAQAVPFEGWQELQKAMSVHFAKAGMQLDVCLERAGQVSFLPNVPTDILDKHDKLIAKGRHPDGTPIHFEHHRIGTRLVDVQNMPAGAWAALQEAREHARAEALRQQQLAAEREIKRAEREALRQQQLAAGGDGLTPVERFNLTYSTRDLMEEYGYIEDPHNPGNWHSPLQTSATFATLLRDDGSWFSLSGSDATAGLGSKQGGGVGGDAFDLFAFFRHGGDKKAAVKAAAQMLGMPPVAKPIQADVGSFTAVPLPEGAPRPFGGLSGPLAAFNGSLWKPHPHGLVPDGKGGIGATRNNLEAALRAPDFCLAVAFDEFLNETMVMDPATGEWRRFSDHDVFNAAACLEREGFRPIAKETMRDAILAVGNDNRIDSAKDWANSLEWDGVARVDTFLTKAFGAEPSNYHTAVSRYMWSGLAGRVLQPGCKCDMAAIASGPQGARKSSVVKAMAPFPEAFGELDLAAEEANLYRLMSGRLVMEMPELTGMRRREVEDLKRFVVAQENVWIEKWRTTPTTYKRRCLFIGTTNEEGILVDATGNRRWLPFRAGVVSMCDPDWVIANRDQLWAEGITLFKANGVMFEAAEQMAKAVHDQFMEHDPWEADIVGWLNTPGIGGKPVDRGYVTTAEVLRGIGLQASHVNRASEMRAAGVLKKLGFVKARKRIDGAPPRPVYVKADEGS